MSEKLDIEWHDYPEIERFVAGVQALCAEAMKIMEASSTPAGYLEPGARVPVSFRAIVDVMLLHDALPEALRCTVWRDGRAGAKGTE